MKDIENLKPCDSCKINIGNYRENEYTNLCGKCWTEIAYNIYKSWSDRKTDHVWVYNAEKLQ